MKTITRIASYLLVLSIGLGAGYYVGFGVSQSTSFALDMGEASYYSAYFNMQMTEGTDSTREEAIQGFLALLKSRKDRKSPWLTEKVYAIDSALANARLSALAQKRGAAKEAQEYLDRAASFCPQIGWQDCSAEKIVNTAQRLDKHELFGTKGSQ